MRSVSAVPLLEVLEHRLAALGVELGDPVPLDVLLALEARAPARPRSPPAGRGSPSRPCARRVAAHGLVAREDVLEDAREDVVDARAAVRRRRALVEDPRPAPLAPAQRLVEDVALAPALEDLLLEVGEGRPRIDRPVVGPADMAADSRLRPPWLRRGWAATRAGGASMRAPRRALLERVYELVARGDGLGAEAPDGAGARVGQRTAEVEDLDAPLAHTGRVDEAPEDVELRRPARQHHGRRVQRAHRAPQAPAVERHRKGERSQAGAPQSQLERLDVQRVEVVGSRRIEDQDALAAVCRRGDAQRRGQPARAVAPGELVLGARSGWPRRARRPPGAGPPRPCARPSAGPGSPRSGDRPWSRRSAPGRRGSGRRWRGPRRAHAPARWRTRCCASRRTPRAGTRPRPARTGDAHPASAAAWGSRSGAPSCAACWG